MKITAFIVANLPYLHLFFFGNNNFAHVGSSFVCTNVIAQGIILETLYYKSHAYPLPQCTLTTISRLTKVSKIHRQKPAENNTGWKNPSIFCISLSTEEGLKKIKHFKYCSLLHWKYF